jgi:hypothetical protein
VPSPGSNTALDGSTAASMELPKESNKSHTEGGTVDEECSLGKERKRIVTGALSHSNVHCALPFTALDVEAAHDHPHILSHKPHCSCLFSQ